MKKLLVLVLMIASLNTWAYVFTARANVSVYPTRVTASVLNHLPVPIVCSGRATAMTAYQNYFYAFMNRVIIYPHNYAYVDVYTTYYNPFISGWADIRCRTL